MKSEDSLLTDVWLEEPVLALGSAERVPSVAMDTFNEIGRRWSRPLTADLEAGEKCV